VLLIVLLLIAPALWAQSAPPPWRLSTLAGGLEAGDGGPAAQASLRFLQGVAVDAQGNIFISDADDHRVRRIDPQGQIRAVAGDGLPGFLGDNEASTRARLNTPYGLSVAATGDLYIADLGNARVRRVYPDGRIETAAGGGISPIPAPGQFVPARSVRLSAPRNVLAAPNGSVYISDFGNNAVLELRSDGNLTTLVSAPNEWRSPAGLALEPNGNLLVADSGNARIRRILLLEPRTLVRAETILQSSPALPLERPTGLAIHPNGTLFIADARGDYLWRIDPQGTRSTVFPGGRDVASDALGNLYTAHGTWLRRLNTANLVEILIGPAFATFRGDGGPAVSARLNNPSGLARDSQGNVYFSDTNNHRIRRIAPDGSISTVAGMGEPGFRGDGAPATQAFLNAPTHLAIDSFDNIYFSDTGNHRVRVFSPGGLIQTAAGTGRAEPSPDGIPAVLASLHTPSGLAFDAQNNLYVSERGLHRVRRFSPGGLISTYAGIGLRGSFGDQGLALLASLNSPAGLAADEAGNLYIADSGNNAIRVVDKSTGRIRLISEEFPGVEAVAARGEFLFATDTRRQRIGVFKPGTPASASTPTTPAIPATPASSVDWIAGRFRENGFNAENGNATAITLNEPAALCLGADGAILFADRLNNRIRLLNPPQQAVELSQSNSPLRLLHAASALEGPVAPALLLNLYMPALTSRDLLEITFDSFLARILTFQPGQLSIQVPEGIAGRPRVTLEVRKGGALLASALLSVQSANPAFFEVPEKPGEILATTENGSLVSEALPARPGDVISLYGTGDGLRTLLDGLNVPLIPLQLEINGLRVPTLYAGAAPGLPSIFQINLRIPDSLRAAGRASVRISSGAFANPTTQTLWIQ
jgi:uncharacterized protein (TIGR03437 family)